MTFDVTKKEIVNSLSTIYEKKEAINIADIVMEEVTKVSKIYRILNPNQQLTETETSILNSIMVRLLKNTPIQYITNKTWFGGLVLYVDESVLIPRPETDELVEWIIGENNKTTNTLSVVDIGCGSGCIALSIKNKLTHFNVTAIDVSEDALEILKKNSNDVGLNIEFKQIDFLDDTQWNCLNKFDIIVSNPPYIKLSESQNMNNNVLQYEPKIALFVPDEDPLLFYDKIALFAKNHLNENGSIYVEINEKLGTETTDLFKQYQFETILKQDLQGKNRFIKAYK